MMKKVLKVVLAFMLVAILIAGGYVAWFLGWLRTVESDCRPQVLTSQQAEAHFQSAMGIFEADGMGEHHSFEALDQALPLLKKAAHHGHREAMNELAGLYITSGVVNMLSFDGYSSVVAGEIGMMWSILANHLGDEISEHNQAAYVYLMDPSKPFPDEVSKLGWPFNMMDTGSLERARRQAYAWRQCWVKMDP